MRTYSTTFVRDNGDKVEVEYGVEGSYSPTTYSPLTGACGGDAPEFSILDVWPDTPAFDALVEHGNRLRVDYEHGTPWQTISAAVRLLPVLIRFRWAKWRARLTDAEEDRLLADLAETYVEDDDSYDDYYEMERS